jgi:DNA ligase (NAD+)
LFGKSFCITGTLSVGRDEMKSLIEKAGGKVSGSVSAKLDYLVCGDKAGSKEDKAKQMGVTILTEDALRAML